VSKQKPFFTVSFYNIAANDPPDTEAKDIYTYLHDPKQFFMFSEVRRYRPEVSYRKYSQG